VVSDVRSCVRPSPPATTGTNGGHLAPGRTLREHSSAPALSLAGCRSRRRHHRHSRPAKARSTGGRTLLPKPVKRTGPRAEASDHGHASQLLSGPRHCDAVCCAQHAAVRKQSSRSLSSDDPPTRATDSKVQIRCACSTVLIGARTRSKSLSRGASPAAGCSPPDVETRSFLVWHDVTCSC